MFSTVGDARHWEEEGLAFVARIESDNDADASYLKQRGFRGRLKAHKRGDFSFCGVIVNAYALADIDEKQSFGRDSLWGIESDESEQYFLEIAYELAGEILAGL